MKKVLLFMLVGMMAVTAQATIIDDFEDGNMDEYTHTVILDVDTGGGSNTAAWQNPAGTAEYVTSAYQSIEQTATIYDGLALGVGEEVRIDLVHSGASQDIGLYVGGTAPVAGTRFDYISVYARNTGELFTRGFDGSSEYGQIGWISPAYTKLFVARTASNTFEVGYYDAGGRNIMATRTPGYANAATYVGFYTDVRGAGTLGNIDNLEIIPEPATLALLGLGGLLLRRKK